jgi:cellulose synthase/poly-beta-1,6-N-acetylglucosamine synthase-like glycosyltransferase
MGTPRQRGVSSWSLSATAVSVRDRSGTPAWSRYPSTSWPSINPAWYWPNTASSAPSVRRTQESAFSNVEREKRIHFIRNDKRRGLAAVQNTILARTATDVLVLLQGDIRLGAPDAISEMIKPILENNADLVVPASRELKPKTFFEQILFASCVMKTRIYENYNNGENIYTCRGIARAFSKKMYQSIHFPTSVGEDAYSYLYCLKKKMKYGFTKKAKVYYRLPNNVKDHLKQSLRFFNSQQLLYKTFKEDFVKKEYSLPKQLLLQSFFQSLMQSPLEMPL